MLKIAKDCLKADQEYQRLLWERRMLEQEYLRIAEALSEQDRVLLDRYITLCEELEHRQCYLTFCNPEYSEQSVCSK